jgi:hypothetical protein
VCFPWPPAENGDTDHRHALADAEEAHRLDEAKVPVAVILILSSIFRVDVMHYF